MMLMDNELMDNVFNLLRFALIRSSSAKVTPKEICFQAYQVVRKLYLVAV